jgi:hypothetical protein
MNLLSLFFLLFLGLTASSSKVFATSEAVTYKDTSPTNSCWRCSKKYSKKRKQLVLTRYSKYKDNDGKPRTSITIPCEHTMCSECYNIVKQTLRDCPWCHADWEHTSDLTPASALGRIAAYGDARSLIIVLDALAKKQRREALLFRSRTGNTPLEAARIYGKEDLVLILESYGARK